MLVDIQICLYRRFKNANDVLIYWLINSYNN